MGKAIVLELLDGEFRCHNIDSDPDVERWAIAFVDTDGAAWVYIASHLRAFTVTKFLDDDDVAEIAVDRHSRRSMTSTRTCSTSRNRRRPWA